MTVGQQTLQSTPQGPPPAYPNLPPLPPHIPALHHALLQQQLLQNPQFAQANANNSGKFNT